MEWVSDALANARSRLRVAAIRIAGCFITPVRYWLDPYVAA